jgi:hypothetical protein
LASAILSAVALLYQPTWNLAWYPYALAAWIFLAVGAVAALFRVLDVFAEVLLGMAEE